ncbi:serine hydrolase [Flavihumibacter sp. CACIAM 22H1]|uniref:serine hydrolase n=1 Tax=Flavihumibacter sp. CACIAM 22H1 TaxID=1812911 RepID=UPI0007A895F5|nr:serine hydrolase [Flavihumibacter sp. CACIAM 22H1]KYP15744.1 MAG: serine hydrolase [Flavihumibacter sp. CACIAM 22H1]
MIQIRPLMLGMAAVWLAAGAVIAQKKQPALPPGLDAYINKVITSLNVPGVSVAIVKDGKVLLSKGYGVKRMDTKEPVDEKTLFLIASNSKAFTATALALLVEEGKIDWNDKVIKHLPWFKMSDPYVTQNLTVRDLLVHHSGLPAYAGDIMLFPPATYSRREILEKLPLIPLKYDFRTVYAYDNILYVAAGELISTVAGIPWENFVQERILKKVGMKETIARFTDLKKSTNFSFGHARSYNTIRVVENFREQNIGDAGNAAGGIVSNAADMANWLITQLDSGRTPIKERVLTPAATADLWKIIRPMPISKVDSLIRPSQADFWGYASGFRSYNYGKYKVIGHGGALSGFVSQIALVPDLNLGVVVLTNQASTAAYWSIIYQVLDYYMGNPSFDWLGGYKRIQDSAVARALARKKDLSILRATGDKPSLALEKYAGSFTEPLLGRATIKMEDQGLVLRFDNTEHMVADLRYFQYNNFIASFRGMGVPTEAYISYGLKADGSVDRVRVLVDDPASQLDFSEMELSPINEKKMDISKLDKAIRAEMSKHPQAEFAIACKDLGTGQTYFVAEKKSFHAASTMKTPVMMEAYKQAAAGKFSLQDKITVKNSFTSIEDGSVFSVSPTDDSEFELYQLIGKELPISDILHRMITKSSNLATNIIIDLVGAKNVMTTMKEIGANQIQVLRGVEDKKAFEAGKNNTTTAYDLMRVFEELGNGSFISKMACADMIRVLQDQYFRNSIPAKLPREVKTATKSGSIVKITHDSGIVYLPDGRKYVVVLLSKGIESQEEANAALAELSKLIYDEIK